MESYFPLISNNDYNELRSSGGLYLALYWYVMWNIIKNCVSMFLASSSVTMRTHNWRSIRFEDINPLGNFFCNGVKMIFQGVYLTWSRHGNNTITDFFVLRNTIAIKLEIAKV